MTRTALSQPLTPDETSATTAYGADAIYFHAVAQGWLTALEGAPKFDAFYKTCGVHSLALDQAIAKSVLTTPLVLYSGHGVGYGARGALAGDPTRFVGLTYQYAGYISCSLAPEVAVDFMRKRSGASTQPTLLAFDLPDGFRVLDMNSAGPTGEFEFLIGRNEPFTVTGAQLFGSGVDACLCLDLVPLRISGH